MNPESYKNHFSLKNPQQNLFTFDKVVFSSEFDSGNLQNVTKIDDSNVNTY